MKFTKMQAYGNDYIYISLFDQEMTNHGAWARYVSHRRFGVGSDGMVLICPSEVADFRMRIFNPDGSEAEMCGNALRSTGMYVYEKGLTNKPNFTVETIGGIKKIFLDVENGKVKNITAAIGAPILNPSAIPVNCDGSRNNALGIKVKALDKEFVLNAISLGNPHCVVFVDDAFNFPIDKYGIAIEKHPVFPKGANVEFVEIVDDNNLRMRTWERNCGETLACATGCSAATVCGYLCGKCSNETTVHQLGGDIGIKYNTDEDCIYMTGRSWFVFDGTVDDNAYKEFLHEAG
ncbi:MAG: diaminopimelate epimerase [Clostridia bacterium]|nr:diaminopimelate epimerase [Clostridia bacterium]